MVNVYITNKFVDGVRYLPILYPHFGILKNEKCLFDDRAKQAFKEPVFNLVKNIKEADFILFPHDFYYFMTGKIGKEYLDIHVLLAKQHNKKLLIFDLSDLTGEEIEVPSSIVFRLAGYRGKMKENEIIMPFFVEDLLKQKEVAWRQKSEKPAVGFCGWAGTKGLKQKAKFRLKNIFMSFVIFFSSDKDFGAHRQGLYFRMKAIKILEKCNNISGNFIARRSYSSHKSTIELPVEQARKEYIENILNSDFSLCVRGDANASFRFYEVLSLGRIPLIIDTVCIFPLEEIVDYKKFALVVDYKDLDNICEAIGDFYKKISDEEFVEMQKNAREAFEKYLNASSFLKYILPRLKVD